MSNHTIQSIALLGKQMRDAQKNYFTLAGLARRTGKPADYAAQKEMLELSKQLEKQYDADVNEILQTAKPEAQQSLNL